MNIPKGKILIVDDEPISLETLSFLLGDDYQVYLANCGVAALELANEVLPDLILLDILMPDMDGYEVFNKLLDNPLLFDIPVLFITAMSESECEAKGLELGAYDYLTKPYNPSIVRLRVRNHLQHKLRNDMLKEQRDLLVHKNADLESAISRIMHLEGIITICMYCKQIRNDYNSWEQLEQYICEHSEARFSHGICPDCLEHHCADLV